MSVRFIPQFTMQLENFLLYVLFRFHNVRLIPLVMLENLPCRKEIFCGDY